jgi:branched-chain amino acid transport system permease protein
MIWINQILQGILLGGYYALMAAGLSFLFGVMRVINLAHGSLAVLAAFLLLVIDHWLGLSPFIGLFLMLPMMALIGIVFQLGILERSLRGGALIPLLATFGVSLLLDNIMFAIFGANTQSFAPDIGSLSYGSWAIGRSIDISQLDALIFATALTLLGGMHLLLTRCQLGRMIRATAIDAEAASLSGIDPRQVRVVASAIAMIMVGVAGAALGMRSSFEPYAGGAQLIYAFEAVVIGGTGSLWGTLIGGIVLGIAQNLGATINPHLSQIGGHLVFLLVLLVRIRMGGFRLGDYLRKHVRQPA